MVAEGMGTAVLVVAVVGSGIMGERLFDGGVGLTLLANAVGTGSTLIALIVTFGPISGGHFNPLVTVADRARSGMRWAEVGSVIIAQVVGATIGVVAAHLMFDQPLLQISDRARTGGAMYFSEFVATFGLLAVISSCARTQTASGPFAVGLYITGACWFTASTSFANPAVTLARVLTDSFAGIRPSDVPGFIAAQIVGAVIATPVMRWLLNGQPRHSAAVATLADKA